MTYKSQTFLQYCWWWWWRIMVITRMLLLKDLFLWWKRTSIYHKWQDLLEAYLIMTTIMTTIIITALVLNDIGPWAWNLSELYLQLEQIQISVSSLLVSLNCTALLGNHLSHMLAEESQGTVSATRIYSTLYVVNTIYNFFYNYNIIYI